MLQQRKETSPTSSFMNIHHYDCTTSSEVKRLLHLCYFSTILCCLLNMHFCPAGGTMHTFSSVQFNPDGTLLASVGGASDYTLTVWNWRQEEVVLRCKAISQEVYRVSFSPYEPGLLTTSGSGHIK